MPMGTDMMLGMFLIIGGVASPPGACSRATSRAVAAPPDIVVSPPEDAPLSPRIGG